MQLTDALRRCLAAQSKPIEEQRAATARFLEFVDAINKSQLPDDEIKAPVKDIGVIVDHESTNTAELRPILARVASPQATGVRKIFFALGKKFLQNARDGLSVSSHDEALLGSMEQLKDRTVVLRSTDFWLATDDAHDHISKACETIEQVAQKSSRSFKEQHQETLMGFVQVCESSLMGLCTRCQDELSQWVAARLPEEIDEADAEAFAALDIDAHIGKLANELPPLAPLVLSSLQSAGVMTPLLITAFGGKGMSFLGGLEKMNNVETIRKRVHVRAKSWIELFNSIADRKRWSTLLDEEHPPSDETVDVVSAYAAAVDRLTTSGFGTRAWKL